MKKFMNLIFAFTILILLPGCSSNSTEPDDVKNYMSLSVGDVREYLDTGFNTYQKWEIKSKIKREDGMDVFVGEWTSSLDTSKFTSYYAISGEYFIATELTKSGNTENPFQEQRLAKVNPKDGDRWQHTLGVPDSEKVFFDAEYIGGRNTPAKYFEDVFSFSLSNIAVIYYAKDFGNIGSTSPLDTSFAINLNYARINDIEIGTYVPLVQNNKMFKKNMNYAVRKVNFLGQFVD